MSEAQRAIPFKIGDRVRFAPNAHACGWTWSSFDRLRLEPGDTGIVTRIEKGCPVLDDERGGMHWECFERAE
jgi:D-serine deaminase-like pyridoxal phosphate-dependent protein